jgi:hypothetical protein
MQGRFARIINIISYGFGTGIFLLAIRSGPSLPAGPAGPSGGEAYICRSSIYYSCSYFYMGQAAQAFGIIVGLIQMITCFLAMATKCVNWVVWIIAHLVALLFSIIGSPLALAWSAQASVPVWHLYGVVFFFNFIFCIVGIIVMVMYRNNTQEPGGPAILEAQAEGMVQKISSGRISKPSRTEPFPQDSTTQQK